MNDLEIAEQKALFILLLESRIQPSKYFPVVRTFEEYNVRVSRDLAEAAFDPWFKNGWAKRYRDGAVVCAKLKQDAYGEAYKTVLEYLGATSLTVHPDQREIMADVRPSKDTPSREGWKWFQFEQDERVPVSAEAVEMAPSEVFRPQKFHLERWAAIATIIGLPLAVVLWWYS